MSRFANQIFPKKIIKMFWFILRKMHLISLDAPLVVVAWKNIISYDFRQVIHVPESLILGASTWLAYSADRHFEKCEIYQIKTSRHSIGRSHPYRFYCIWAAIFVITIVFSFIVLHANTLKVGGILFVLVIINFLICQLQKFSQVGSFVKNIRTAAILVFSCFFWELENLKFEEGLVSGILLFFVFLHNCQILRGLELKYSSTHRRCSRYSGKDKANRLLILGQVLIILILAIWSFLNTNKIYPLVPLFILCSVFILRKAISQESRFRVMLDFFYWAIPSLILIVVY